MCHFYLTDAYGNGREVICIPWTQRAYSSAKPNCSHLFCSKTLTLSGPPRMQMETIYYCFALSFLMQTLQLQGICIVWNEDNNVLRNKILGRSQKG